MSEPCRFSTVLHSSTEVLSRRHLPSYLLLAMSAGAVNAGALLACDRFVTHVTGTVTRIGVDAGTWLLMLDYGLVLVAFIGGAMASVLALQARAHSDKPPLHALPLYVVASILTLTAIGGRLGWFGSFAGHSEEHSDFALMCVLAFAMGLMNASVATSTALSVRTTHMTGPATDFGVQVASAWLTTGAERNRALLLAALRGGKLVAFILGASLMVPAARVLEYGAFVLPAIAVAAAAVRSFRSQHDSTRFVLSAQEESGVS